ncbi:MAG: sel1 repeat family protein, partial [Lachnospiraceae bacterium]|nr:sel1 repeat family protein [Lachnospiraceae bacterium]
TAAFETCKEMADAGNIYCMYWCGRCYQAGNGVEQSYREAIDLYEKANEAAGERNSKACCFEALLDLGQLCERGHGFSQDYEKAYDYYKEAADAGYGKAAYYIGLLYHWGHRGVDADGNYDYELARQWYDKALECGCTDAYNNIGVIYKEGLGKYPADTDKALEYYQKGADMGNSLCMRNIAYIYDGRGEYEEAIPWFLKASDFGDNVSDYYLGYYYETARGVEKDEAKAFEYYLKAANAGHVNAMIIVTECYQYGELTAEKNAEKAFSWCQKAAAEEKPEAMDMLGNMYMSGFGTKKDAFTASKWFEKAANLGYAQAAYHLACLLLSGEDGVTRDAATGLVWMRKAAESDVADSKYWLGYYLVKGGDGITKNEKEGLSILEEVAAGGNTNSMKVIADYHYDHFNTETAVQWYERAVTAGLKDGETYLRLGRYYRDSTFPDEATAMKWLTKAYEENANLDAADYGFLGHRYNMGEIVKQDLDLAFQCFMKGAEVGDSYCMAYLGLFYETGKVGEPNPQEALKWYGAAIQTGLQVDYCTNRIEIMVRKGQITEEEAAQYLPNQN